MRLARLHLEKYGHLTDATLDLSARAPDLHLILGANEAGKSTTQAAIADLLFGFGHKTRFDYRHAQADLRVGARLEADGVSLDAWRRKGRADTLLGADGAVLDEAPLAALLGGVERAAFEQQFSLSHDRLRAGGQAMLRADSDLGRVLFQAGAGLEGLGARLDALEAEADRLFKPRGQTQVVAVAWRRRTEALRRQREATVSDRDYAAARRAAAEAQAAREAESARHGALHARRARLERARRVSPLLSGIDAALDERRELADAPDLPADTRDRLTAAARAAEAARDKARDAAEAAARARAARDAITVDEALLARADEIALLLDTRRGRFVTAEEDGPKREAERRAHEDTIRALGREVGLPGLTAATVADHRPTRARMATLRTLAARHASVAPAAAAAAQARDKARHALARARAEVEAMGPGPDPAALVQVLDAATADPGLGERLRGARDRVDGIRDEIERARAALAPPAPEGTARAALPMTAAAGAMAETLAARDAALQDLRQRRDDLDRDRADKDRQRRDLVEHGGAVPETRLTEARDRRDAGWARLRGRLAEGVVPEEAALDAHAAALAEADRVADDRFAAAATSGQLAAREADLRALDAARAGVATAIAEAGERRAALLESWRAAWAGSGVDPGPPAVMAAWLRALEAVEALAVDLARAEADRADLQAVETRHRVALGRALADLGEAGAEDESLTERVRRAQRLRSTLDQRVHARTRAEDAVRRLTEAEAEATTAATAAGRALDTWRADWAAALAAWVLPAETDPAAVDPVLDAWDTIGRAHDAIAGADGLAHRIATMHRDQMVFRDDLARLLAAVAPDLADQPPLRAAQALGERLETARTQRARREDAAGRVDACEEALATARDGERHAHAALAASLARLGVETVEAAAPILDRIERRAALDATVSAARARLAEAGDGRTEADVRTEVAGLAADGIAEGDVDAIGARLDTVAEDERRAFDAVQALSEELARHRATVEGFDQAGAAAAEAAEDAEQARAEALRAAERAIRVRATATLLRHAIARYQAENEAPLLSRAGALFGALTLGRYGGLLVDREDPDAPSLRARPADGGATVPMEGLSDGARDQLFLALRLAGLEALLARGTRLPFIADDLFVHFDDARAAAGLRVLADLAARTQVLVFTHHRHLVDLAEAAIPGRFAPRDMGA
ncbi:YhaN family protein [Roseospira visakhapatnamensis]|uniref:Uncharacterized protein YhaN n=1 Tax=Roseospira visakhapatnamensis TaxID=390880 RepID=A0A7W6W990_9PROT|nr:YhaN family protein [Roseospira visakhapatnamensis]MBB4265639.1 uncharacterized protein YhaN [Roseospira visakhapatnamensis]